MFDAVDIAGSATAVDQTWMDTIAGNIANMNNAVTPGQQVYRPEYVEAEATAPSPSNPDGPGEGVHVANVILGSAQGQIVNDPTNPVANAQGNVEYPQIDLASEMTDLIQSQTSYQANSAVMSHSTTAYQAILDIKA